MASVVKLTSSSLISRLLSRHSTVCLRRVTTTPSQKDNPQQCEGKEEWPYKFPPDFSKPLENKNWMSFGFSETDQKEDILRMHSFTFMLVTVFFIGGGFIIAYFPDARKKSWAAREAFIRLHERELQGLQPIDPNYVDPSKIRLPSDAELENVEIII